jgi:hypothetical protein
MTSTLAETNLLPKRQHKLDRERAKLRHAIEQAIAEGRS